MRILARSKDRAGPYATRSLTFAALCSGVQRHFCNRLVRFDHAFVNTVVLRLNREA
jgi:hypothetical protein